MIFGLGESTNPSILTSTACPVGTQGRSRHLMLRYPALANSENISFHRCCYQNSGCRQMVWTRKVFRENRINNTADNSSKREPAVKALDLLFEDRASVTSVRSDLDAAKGITNGALDSENMSLLSLSQELVKSLYEVILRREADRLGLSDYSQEVNRRGLLAGVPHVVQQLLASEEYVGKFDLRISDRMLSQDVVPTYGPVENLISLGTTCYSSWLMQQCGCKRWSGPFDWIFSSIDMIEHCLSDDFATFLDAGSIEVLDGGEKSTHAIYQAMISERAVFNHHNLTKHEHRAYFQRCVRRFRHALESTARKCFFMILVRQSDREDDRLIADYHRLEQALNARTTNFRLIIVAHDGIQTKLGNSIRELGPYKRDSLVRFRSTSEMQDGLSFSQAWDNVAMKRLLWTNDLALHPLSEDAV